MPSEVESLESVYYTNFFGLWRMHHRTTVEPIKFRFTDEVKGNFMRNYYNEVVVNHKNHERVTRIQNNVLFMKTLHRVDLRFFHLRQLFYYSSARSAL